MQCGLHFRVHYISVRGLAPNLDIIHLWHDGTAFGIFKSVCDLNLRRSRQSISIIILEVIV